MKIVWRFSWNIISYFFRQIGKMSQHLSSAAVLIGDLRAIVFVVLYHFPKCVLIHIRIKGEVGAVKLV